jgi:hypothetical protein
MVGIYTDGASGPGALIASGTLAAPTAGGWVDVPMSNTAVLAGTRYWIALLTPFGAGTLAFRDTASGGGTSVSSASSVLSSLPASWTSGLAFTNAPVSVAGLG